MKQPIPQTTPDEDGARLIERPDGFYWQARDGARLYGPFATLLEAMQDMAPVEGDEATEPGESLQEAEAEIGIADWIDPDTGQPGEEERARIEEH